MRLNDIQISPNFRLREFQCPCCHAVTLHPKLLAAMQKLRGDLAAPLIVTSGYRCARHNSDVGGARNSLHRRGLAADVAVAPTCQSRFCEMAKKAGFARAIAYPRRSFVHLEAAADGE